LNLLEMQTGATDSIGFLIVDLARLFRQEFERAVAAEGFEVTAGEARTLLHLSYCEGIRQSVLADRMRVEPMTLSNFLDRLEGRGLICRVPDPRDRRAKQVEIADAARPLVERIHALAARVRARAARGLSAAEVEACRRALQAMRESLTQTAERDAA
jgi:DNA-binding MarR family transcriptional regulator